ncbi:HupE/UreJ family protein [Roseibium sp. RKSG952]|nr:HupE/UreJ family protein [Roseibium sp. RKSG952]
MRSIVDLTIILRFCLIFILFFTALLTWSQQVTAQPASPTVVDFRVDGDRLFLDISMNAEAALVGGDPSEALRSARYRELRRLVSTELESELHEFINSWKGTLQVDANGPIELSYEGSRIPVVGNPDVVRISRVLLTGELPSGASALRLTWPADSGPMVLKQQGVDAPYTGYLDGGETSPLIPLQGGAGLDARQTLETYFPKGISRVLPHGPEQIIFVLAMLFLSVRARPALIQYLIMVLGVTTAATLGTYQMIGVSEAASAQLLPITIVVVAVWNLFARRLGFLRVFLVFLAALPHGIALSDSLSKVGIPPDRVPPALLGYLSGALLAMLAIMISAYFVTLLLSRGSHRYRGRISILASMMIALIGVYLSLGPYLPI